MCVCVCVCVFVYICIYNRAGVSSAQGWHFGEFHPSLSPPLDSGRESWGFKALLLGVVCLLPGVVCLLPLLAEVALVGLARIWA